MVLAGERAARELCPFVGWDSCKPAAAHGPRLQDTDGSPSCGVERGLLELCNDLRLQVLVTDQS